MVDFQVVKFAQVTSTMDVAKELPPPLNSLGMPYAVMARHQSHGRGRRGKVWVSSDSKSNRGEGPNSFALEHAVESTFSRSHEGERDLLPMTLVFPGKSIQVPLSWFSIAAGCALLDAAHDLAVFLGSAFSEIFQIPIENPKRIFLKWPNDIVSLTGKIAGLLVETSTQNGRSDAVSLGIGLNLFEAPAIAGAESLIDAILGFGANEAHDGKTLSARDPFARRRKAEKWVTSEENRALVLGRFLESLQNELFEYICVPRTIGQLRSLALARMFPIGTVFEVQDPLHHSDEPQRIESKKLDQETGCFIGLGDDGSLLLKGHPPLYSAEVSVKAVQTACMRIHTASSEVRSNGQEGSSSSNVDLKGMKSLSENPLNRGTADRRVHEKGTQGRPADEELEGFRIGSKDKARKLPVALDSKETKETRVESVKPESAGLALLLDAGNTRLHWALVFPDQASGKATSLAENAHKATALNHKHNEVSSIGHIPYEANHDGRKLSFTHESFRELLGKLHLFRKQPLKVCWFSVLGRKETTQLLASIRLALEGAFPELKVSLIGIDSKTVLGVDSALKSTFDHYGSSLGTDRALKLHFAYGEARSIQGPVAVLSLGTATTFEVVAPASFASNEKAQSTVLMESLILPGIQMSFDALSAGTAALPLIEYHDLSHENLVLQKDRGTEASIARGVLYSLFSACQFLCKSYKVKKLWICGGTAAHFFSCTKAFDWSDAYQVEVSENLGLQALAAWLSSHRVKTTNEGSDSFQPLLVHNMALDASFTNGVDAKELEEDHRVLPDEGDYSFLGEESEKVAASLFRGRKHYRQISDLEPVAADFRRLGARIETVGVGERLDRHLGSKFRFHSRSEWFERIKRGEVKIEPRASKFRYDDVPPLLEGVKHTYRLKPFDQIWMFQPAEYEPGFVKETKTIRDDGDTIVFHKPGNLVVHATGLYGRNTFLDVLEDQGHNNVFPVHRIDRETSGILLCARLADTRRNLASLFRDEAMTKMYLAFAKSFAPLPREFVIDAPIGPAPLINQSRIRLKMWVGESLESAAARTRFVSVGKKDDYTLFLCFPETGRTNQIRVHLAAVGQWIVGDKMYHPDENVFLSYFDHGLTQELLQCLQIPRHALHNCAIFGNPERAGIFKDGPVVCPLSQDLMEFRLFRDLLEESKIGLSELHQSEALLRLFLEHAPLEKSSRSSKSSIAEVPVFHMNDLKEIYHRATASFPKLHLNLVGTENQRGLR